MKSTQHSRMAVLLKKKTGATAYDLALASGSVSVHRRLTELRRKGWTITRKPVDGENYGRYYGKPPCK